MNKASITLLLLTSLLLLPLPLSAKEQSPIGINLSTVKDWSSEIVFIDLFKRARPWTSIDQKGQYTKNPIRTDKNGWILSLVEDQ